MFMNTYLSLHIGKLALTFMCMSLLQPEAILVQPKPKPISIIAWLKFALCDVYYLFFFVLKSVLLPGVLKVDYRGIAHHDYNLSFIYNAICEDFIAHGAI